MTEVKKKSLTQLRADSTKAANAGNVADAINLLKDVLEAEPADARTADKLGDLYAREGDPFAAVHYYRRAADTYERDDLLDRAIAVWAKVIRLRPELIDVYVWLADLYVRAGRAPDAKRLYGHALVQLQDRKQPELMAILKARLEGLGTEAERRSAS